MGKRYKVIIQNNSQYIVEVIAESKQEAIDYAKSQIVWDLGELKNNKTLKGSGELKVNATIPL